MSYYNIYWYIIFNIKKYKNVNIYTQITQRGSVHFSCSLGSDPSLSFPLTNSYFIPTLTSLIQWLCQNPLRVWGEALNERSKLIVIKPHINNLGNNHTLVLFYYYCLNVLYYVLMCVIIVCFVIIYCMFVVYIVPYILIFRYYILIGYIL